MAEILVVINGGHAGYRRAGLAFRAGRNEFDPSVLSADQLAQLHADPGLVVTQETAHQDAAGPLGDGDVHASVAPMPSHYAPVIAAQSPAPAAPSKPARKRSTKGA